MTADHEEKRKQRELGGQLRRRCAAAVQSDQRRATGSEGRTSNVLLEEPEVVASVGNRGAVTDVARLGAEVIPNLRDARDGRSARRDRARPNGGIGASRRTDGPRPASSAPDSIWALAWSQEGDGMSIASSLARWLVKLPSTDRGEAVVEAAGEGRRRGELGVGRRHG
jgi:hypothetical protein